MSRFRNLGKPFAAAAVLFAAMDASSLTLGRLEGAAVLGRPLDVSVTVQPGPSGDAAVACLDAAVAYGDTRQPAGSVSVGVDTRSDQSLLVNVYVNVPVSEPFVTLDLHAGCGTKISRRYILFADPAGGGPLLATPPTTASPGGVALTLETSAGASAPTPAGPGPQRQVAQTAPERPPVAAAKRQTPPAAKPEATAPAPAHAASPVPAESPANVAGLQRSADAAPPSKQESQHAAEPTSAPLQALEADVKALQAATAKNQQNLQRIAGTVAPAEAPNYPVLLIAAAACALALAALLAFKRSKARASSQPWWDPGQDQAPVHPDNPAGAVAHATTAAAGAPAAVAVAKLGAHQDASSVLEVDIVLGDSEFQELDASVPQVAPLPTAAASTGNRSLGYGDAAAAGTQLSKVREMPDVRQEAEFFVALGQHEEATKVLEASIQSSAESIPLVYLDLLALLHTLSRREAFDRYRVQFLQQFTGLLPDYSNFLAEGNGLEAYAEICSQIEALWPSSDAFAYIEACLIRQPEDQPGQGFDLLAYRDLLMLHGVLRHLGSVPDSQPAAFTTSDRQDLRSQVVEPQRDSFPNATQPLAPVAPSQKPGHGETDFDVTAPPNNLIEFDIGDLGPAKNSKD